MHIRHAEYKEIYLEGLNALEHNKSIDKFREDGWIIYSVRPNIDSMKMEYRMKRPLYNLEEQ